MQWVHLIPILTLELVCKGQSQRAALAWRVTHHEVSLTLITTGTVDGESQRERERLGGRSMM